MRGGSQWTRGKSFDTFCPLGPCLVTLNDMIFEVPALIAFLSASATLLPGTVILTGTPHDVGMARRPPRWLWPGDVVSVEVEKIGTLTNPVEAEP